MTEHMLYVCNWTTLDNWIGQEKHDFYGEQALQKRFYQRNFSFVCISMFSVK